MKKGASLAPFFFWAVGENCPNLIQMSRNCLFAHFDFCVMIHVVFFVDAI